MHSVIQFKILTEMNTLTGKIYLKAVFQNNETPPKATERRYLRHGFIFQCIFKIKVLKSNYLHWLNHSVSLLSLAVTIIITKYD